MQRSITISRHIFKHLSSQAFLPIRRHFATAAMTDLPSKLTLICSVLSVVVFSCVSFAFSVFLCLFHAINLFVHTDFDARFRAEPSRLLLAAANVKYEDRRIKFDDWKALKPTLEWEQLPVLEVCCAVFHAMPMHLPRKFCKKP